MKKNIVLLFCVTTLLSAPATIAFASEASKAPEAIVFASASNYDLADNQNEGSIIAPFADVIEYKYREYNGRLQYRRWNSTKGFWVDPDWIYYN